MRKAIIERASVRNYDSKMLEDNVIEEIKEKIKSINKESGLNIQFLEDGSNLFAGAKLSYGMFSNVKSMVIMKGNKEDNNLKEKAGYYGEKLVLDLTDMNLGTCWVGATFNKEKLNIPNDEEFVALILLGLAKKSFKDGVIQKVMHAKRKDYKDRIIASYKGNLPKWIVDGAIAMTYAPSAYNSQKATLKYENGKLSIFIADDAPFDMVDLGIAKCNFEQETNKKFEQGNNASLMKT